MAAASDKARFYLEQYVPELQEYQQKGIFSRDEITAVASKRSDFEHTLNARGATPADYARYASYEINLDTLRKKRCRRLGVKATNFHGQRTIFFVLDRATKKFPADMGLWMQYINFCTKEKANKKLARVLTSVLRLHPRDSSLWVLAAKHYAETQGDMGTARSYLQRGLRFCRDEKRLYLEYAKLEMAYLAKLAARRSILGIDDSRANEEKPQDDEGTISLPIITAEDLDLDAGQGIEEVDENALKRLEFAPAFSGAVPMAIFDAAVGNLKAEASRIAEDFFDLVASFDGVPTTPRILKHILHHLHVEAPNSVETVICDAKQEFFAVDPCGPLFPSALGRALALVKRGGQTVPENKRPSLMEKAVLMLMPFFADAKSPGLLDSDVAVVIEASLKRYLRSLAESSTKFGKDIGSRAAAKLRSIGHGIDAEVVERLIREAGIR